MAKSILAGKKGIIIPAALAVLALLLTFQYIKQREEALGLRAEPVKVVVAKQNIPRLTRLDETLVEVNEIPRQFVQPGALKSLKEVMRQVNTAPILKGEQVLGTKLAAFGAETGLAIKVPKGMRAVTVATNLVTGVAGLIKPGNFVDVLGTFEFGDMKKSDKKTFTVFQNVLVLAVEQNIGIESEAAKAMTMKEREEKGSAPQVPGSLPFGRTKKGATNATLALTPQQAQGLVLAQSSGDISLVLRSIFESREVAPLAPSNLNNLLGTNEKVMFQIRPWKEIRGTESR